jgi:hypothetical protein
MTPDCRHDGNQLAPGALETQPAAHLPLPVLGRYYEPKHAHVVPRIQHLHRKPIAVRDSSDEHLV